MESPSPSPTGNAVLDEALAQGRPRFFRATRNSATGHTGDADTARFAEDLMVMQECALLLGEQLGMHAVSSAVCYEDGETFGFCYDPNSNPQDPVVAGGIVNRRHAIRDFVNAIRDDINA